MKIEANLENVKEIETLPGNVYSAFISGEPKFIESSKQKTPGLDFVFKLTDPGTEIASGIPRTIRHTIWKSAEMGWEHFKTKEICEACGVPLQDPDTEMFVGATLKLALAIETFTDKSGKERTKNVVDHFLPA